MKVKVLKPFFNKITKVDQNIDDEIVLDLDRANYAIEQGLAIEIETEKKESKPKTAKKEK